MNENDLIKLVRERLDQGAQEIDGITLRRLAEARHRALGQVRVAQRELAAGSQQNGQMALKLGGGHDTHPMFLKALFAGLALIALMAGTAYWQEANDPDDEQGLLDAKMLSSELPLNTFVHPDFKEWVNSSR